MKIKEKDGLGELSVGSSRPADGGRSDGIVVKLIQSIDTVTRGPIETGADLTPGGGWRNDKHWYGSNEVFNWRCVEKSQSGRFLFLLHSTTLFLSLLKKYKKKKKKKKKKRFLSVSLSLSLSLSLFILCSSLFTFCWLISFAEVSQVVAL